MRCLRITTIRRFKCGIQKWVKPVASLPLRLSLILRVVSLLLTKVVPKNYPSHSYQQRSKNYFILKEHQRDVDKMP